MLSVENLEAGYGAAQVLFGVDLSIVRGEAVTLMGRNGMGKTTAIRALMGLTRPSAGTVRFRETRIDGLPPHRIARLGIGLVPEGRQIFSKLSVEENLVATAATYPDRQSRWSLAQVFDQFPQLAERRRQGAGTLSGGEQQMLAIARALMTNPHLLILDEATEGLAPRIREEIWQALAKLKALGVALLIVDRNIDALLRLADRHYVIAKGKVVWRGTSSELKANRATIESQIGV
jgi:branched-chain amino acid transport system ATP-binding protein